MTSTTTFLMSRGYRLSVMNRRNPNIVLGIIVASILIISIVVVAISSNRPVAEFEEATPESVTQSYLVAVFDGNYDLASEYIEPESNCDASDLDRAYFDKNARVNLLDVDITEDRARVKVVIEFPTGDPFNNYYTEETVFRLVEIDGDWKITGVPWPLYDCSLAAK
jgi:hypothetical protein